MTIYHTVVWLDHAEAKVFQFEAGAIHEAHVRAPDPHLHVHNKAAASGRREDHAPYYQAVAEALEPSREVLIVGPSTAKLELIRHLHRHAPALESRVVGVESVDHPSDGQLVAYAQKYFRAADRLR